MAVEVAAEVSSQYSSCTEHRSEIRLRAHNEDIMRSPTSMSNRKPRKEARTGGAEKAIVEFGEVIEGVIVTME